MTRMSDTLGPVLYAGDTHGRLTHVVEHALALNASAVILLGDIEAPAPLHEVLAPIVDRVWWLAGNHDTDSAANFNFLWDSHLAERNIHGRVVMLPNGIRAAGLSGIPRGQVWDPSIAGVEPRYRNRLEHAFATPEQERWRDGPPLRHWSSWYPDELDNLSELSADVLCTHAAFGYHPHGWAILDTLAQAMGAKVGVHAHEHDQLSSADTWAKQGFKSYGVGLRGITAIDADGNATVIVPGELDEQRNFRQRYLDVFKDVEQ